MPWTGEIQGGLDANEQDGFSWFASETLTVSNDSLVYKVLKIEHCGAYEKTEFSMTTTPDTQQLLSAKHEVCAFEEYGDQEKRTVIEKVELSFKDGKPSQVSVVQNSKPTAKNHLLSVNLNLSFSS